jgi:hypothetical protein
VPRLIDADALAKDIDGDLLDGIAEARALEKIDNAPTIGGWISMKERPPEISGHYLVSCVTNKTGRRWEVPVNAEWLTSRHEWYIETENCLATAAGVTVTHYMPLPEPPEEDEA